MKTLLLIINRKYGGGAERVFEIIRQGFDQSEYKVVVLYTHQKIKLPRLVRLIYCYFKVVYFSLRHNPYIISGLHEENFLAFFAPTLKRKILSLHNNEFPSGVIGFIHNSIYKWASKTKKINLVTVSNGLNYAYKQKIPNFDSDVIHNSLLEKNYNFDKNLFDKNLAFKPKAMNKILLVGRFVEQKNILLAIKIFTVWQKENKQLILTIIGKGPEKEAIKDAIKINGLSDRIILKDWTSSLNKDYEDNDILLFSSKIEGFGNVIIEAISNGLYVFSNDCKFGPKEILFPCRNILEELKDDYISNNLGTLIKYDIDEDEVIIVDRFKRAYESFVRLNNNHFSEANKKIIYERFKTKNLIKSYKNLLEK